ncbi:Polygalacturonase QRT3 [Acorus gramineus]|uniref:Polygalacturonase QRT3 n=1 Tax=Acorus gramineus TaxID=55184 RepID=A0AAV9BXK7_ACOGR|nr:Polygalacturonase QRT3 [Acorus gramineus]
MRPMKALHCLLLLLCIHAATASRPARLTVREHLSRFRETAAARSLSSTWDGPLRSRILNPIEYGADPTGAGDSSDAFMQAVADAYSMRRGLELLPGISDLGGVVIDLQGGNYNISKPIVFPSGSGNLVMQGGTLRASPTFPPDGYLIDLQSPTSAPNNYHYEDITFRDLLFDSSYVSGGLHVLDSVRTRVDNCFFIHFSTRGILVESGHETFVSNTFLGQHVTAGGDPLERNFTGTAIELASNDNVLTDIAIFSAATGVVLRGQANILTGVHCYNKATFWGGVGVLVSLPGLGQTRIDNCYMDYTGIVLEDPVQVHITNAFFLGDANIVLKSKNGKVSGLNIVDNMFSGSNKGVPIVHLDESGGAFRDVNQVVIDRNNVNGMALKASVARSVTRAQGSQWVFDFSPVLVFPNRIYDVQYSLYLEGSAFTMHAITDVLNNTVVVRSANPVDAVVSMVVDQNSMLGEQSPFLSKNTS